MLKHIFFYNFLCFDTRVNVKKSKYAFSRILLFVTDTLGEKIITNKKAEMHVPFVER